MIQKLLTRLRDWRRGYTDADMASIRRKYAGAAGPGNWFVVSPAERRALESPEYEQWPGPSIAELDQPRQRRANQEARDRLDSMTTERYASERVMLNGMMAEAAESARLAGQRRQLESAVTFPEEVRREFIPEQWAVAAVGYEMGVATERERCAAIADAQEESAIDKEAQAACSNIGVLIRQGGAQAPQGAQEEPTP